MVGHKCTEKKQMKWHLQWGCPADSMEPLGLPRQDRPTNIVTLPVFMRTLRRSSITLTHKSMPGAEYATTVLGTFRFVPCLLLLLCPAGIWFLHVGCCSSFLMVIVVVVVVGDTLWPKPLPSRVFFRKRSKWNSQKEINHGPEIMDETTNSSILPTRKPYIFLISCMFLYQAPLTTTTKKICWWLCSAWFVEK